MLIFHFHQHSENQRPFGGVSNLKFVHMININKMAAIFQILIMADTDIPFLLTLGKPKTQTSGVSNLKFFRMININEMAAIFQFFHNGQHWYSISVGTWKTGDPNFGGSVYWNFSLWLILMKWQPFFHNGQCWYSASVDTQKTRDQNFGGSVIWNFSVQSILTKWRQFFNFFIMADTDILSILGKQQMWIFG